MFNKVPGLKATSNFIDSSVHSKNNDMILAGKTDGNAKEKCMQPSQIPLWTTLDPDNSALLESAGEIGTPVSSK